MDAEGRRARAGTKADNLGPGSAGGAQGARPPRAPFADGHRGRCCVRKEPFSLDEGGRIAARGRSSPGVGVEAPAAPTARSPGRGEDVGLQEVRAGERADRRRRRGRPPGARPMFTGSRPSSTKGPFGGAVVVEGMTPPTTVPPRGDGRRTLARAKDADGSGTCSGLSLPWMDEARHQILEPFGRANPSGGWIRAEGLIGPEGADAAHVARDHRVEWPAYGTGLRCHPGDRAPAGRFTGPAEARPRYVPLLDRRERRRRRRRLAGQNRRRNSFDGRVPFEEWPRPAVGP